LGGRGRQISEFEASLVYRVSSRAAIAIQRNPVLKNQKIKNKKEEEEEKKEKKEEEEEEDEEEEILLA
jgi:ribosomal protein L12E/L44/L45/RPP1/RPP2